MFAVTDLRNAPPILSFRLAEKKERAAPGVRKKRALSGGIPSFATPTAEGFASLAPLPGWLTYKMKTIQYTNDLKIDKDIPGVR